MNEHKKIKVLAIDDNQDHLSVIEAILKRDLPGTAVFTADRWEKGLELALAECPDVVLLDIVMPEMSGIGACRRLKAEPLLKDVPVLFMTASGTEKEPAAEAGGEGFLPKPFEAQELTAQVLRMAGLRAARARENQAAPAPDRARELEKALADHKQTEALLRESEARYRTLYESSRDAIMTLFPPDWRFTSGNPATIAMFGAKDEADFTARKPWEISPEYQPDGAQSSAKAAEQIRTAMETGTNYFEWTHKKIGGPDFPATVLLTRIELDGKAGLQATVRDVSAQKRVEGEREKLKEQFLQAQKMEAIGHLAGGVAHDFNNILTAILGYACFLGAAIPAGKAKAGDAEEIIKAAERAATLTRQLLTFSRRQAVQLQPLDLDRIVLGMIAMLRRMIGEDIEVKAFLNSAPAAVQANQGQLEQVLLNLAVNARDAMPDGGELTFETAQAALEVDCAAEHPGVPPGRYVVLTVRDTGRGMSPEIAGRIFEPFFTTKERGKGTGLGLSTVYGIVKHSGGSIAVHSEPGKGTTFRLYFPAAAVKAMERPVEKPAPFSRRGTETILLVEDDESVRKVARRILAQNGYSVLEAATPREALELCGRRGDIQLLLTDLVMPQMNGCDLAKAASALVPRMKVIFMSGYAGNSVLRDNIPDCGALLLEKPLNAETVLSLVREVLEARPQNEQLSGGGGGSDDQKMFPIAQDLPEKGPARGR